ncbi:MAG: YHS domain-containing protein [Candidatus Paceibacterota bacterium]|jgi:Cu+-exporting ATPase
MENTEHPSTKVFDVVCGMELDMESVRHAYEHEGIEYYFCSAKCKGRFFEDPDAYIGKS